MLKLLYHMTCYLFSTHNFSFPYSKRHSPEEIIGNEQNFYRLSLGSAQNMFFAIERLGRFTLQHHVELFQHFYLAGGFSV